MQKDVVISLFDVSGVMIKPWLAAGYECWIVDIQHPLAHDSGGISRDKNGLVRVHADLTQPWLPPRDILNRIAFVAAFPPCDHLAVSGARWFRGKGLRTLAVSTQMFATAAELLDWLDAPGFLENPVSTMSTYWRRHDYLFHPWFFTGYNIDDNYTKKTCLWANDAFVMPESFIKSGLAAPDDRIHKCPPGPQRQAIRSATPSGFAKAVFKANSLRAKASHQTTGIPA